MNQIFDRNTLVLTPNQRLATYLRHQYAKQMSNEIFALDQWLEKLCIDCHDQKLLLTQTQESLIWRQLIEAEGIAVSPIVLEKVLEAWKLTEKWKFNPELWQGQNHSHEVKSFAVWYNKFRALCATHNFICINQLPDVISTYLANNNIKLPQNIILFGFNELTPQINLLLHHLKQNNVRINTIDQINHLNSKKERISFNSQEEELIAMASWAKQKLSQNPAATIGCVVPNLNKLHKRLKRYFKETFHGGTIFNICRNETFADIPLINSALTLLDIQEPSQLETLPQLLLPFVPKEKKAIPLQKLSELKLKPSEWVPLFNNHLKQFGWKEEELLQNFLQQFTAIDLITDKISFPTALTYLQQQASDTIITPSSTWQTVNILDNLEASNMNFTYLWISGMDNANWPKASNLNPFLPHTPAKCELEHCEAITKGFKHCANEVIFSSVNQIDGHSIKPSSLIIELQEVTASALKLNLNTSLYQIDNKYQTETSNDYIGPEIAPHTSIKGGSKVFELQSLCPFRAFAELRLNAKELPEPEFGISEKTRGILLHQALQHIWQLLKNQRQLLELAEAELRNLINECVTKAIKTLGDNSPFYAFEQKTLADLLWQFLLQEKSRAPFAILATEKNLDFTLEGITVNLRIDRMDELSDKSTLIIDYKTGKHLPALSDWFSERPKNLQLPLYSIATDGKHNLALMQINPDAIKFIPISLEKTNKDLITSWRSYLEKLATDFKCGKADVDPIDNKTCELCKLQPLCRVSSKNRSSLLPEGKQQKADTIPSEQEKTNQLATTPLDNRERQEALDITKSFIVQAPAGSGKTTLLTKRFLALLAKSKHPESILAITFTRLAANEMRARIVQALELETKDKSMQELALKILKNPERLRIQTIDAFCLSLTERLPILARPETGANIANSAEAENCYRLATRELLEHLEDPDYAPHIEVILLYLHNNWGKFEKLCIEMLKRRLQWLPHVVGNKQDRKTLEMALEQITKENIEKVLPFFPQELEPELLDLLSYAKENLLSTSPNLHVPIDAWSFKDWEFVATLLLTSTFTWRINIGKQQGFPASSDATSPEAKKLYKSKKMQMQEVLKKLAGEENFRQSLQELLSTPPITYNENEWQVCDALLHLLPLLTAHLQLIFRAQNLTDYTEIAVRAERSLGTNTIPSELALNLDYQIQHILIDEFQDTSMAQLRLIERITAGWEPADGRTLFVVGDPMQSIYRFREADVGIFLRAQNEGIGNIKLHPLTLTTNFRSTEELTKWINNNFSKVLPKKADVLYQAVPFSPGAAVYTNSQATAQIKLFANADRLDEASQTVDLVSKLQTNFPNDTIAILVRSRTHLEAIIPALNNSKIAFQGVELEALKTNPLIEDLFSLTRAFYNPWDRIAWLAILRAPWCGLTLTDLYAIANGPYTTIKENIEKFSELDLTLDGKKRLAKFQAILKDAWQKRGRSYLRDLIEQTWINLHGPSYITTPSDLENAKTYFALLEKEPITLEMLEKTLEDLYATTYSQAKLQIMTIHKAKGLEFDHVIIPGIHKTSRGDEKKLLLWLERPRLHAGSDLVLAPIGNKNSETNSIYNYLRLVERKKTSYENGRLLYVAATRAKKTLHMLGAIAVNDNEAGKSYSIPKNSLLEQLENCFNPEWIVPTKAMTN